MRKARCAECGGKREPYRPVVKRADGSVDFVCKQCWIAWEYQPFMWVELTPDDVAALRKYR